MEDLERDLSSTWSCFLCTYKNIGGHLTCDLCSTPRFTQEGTENNAIKKQAELLLRQWSCPICTFDNIQGAKKCAKCNYDRPIEEKISSRSPINVVRSTPPSIEQTHRSMPRKEISSVADATSSNNFKWKCSRCTYLNFPNACRCTMCSLPRPMKCQRSMRLSKDFFKPVTCPAPLDIKRNFLLTGTLSRYTNFFTGHSMREELFFRAVGAIVSNDLIALNEVINYLINDGNVHRSLNLIESIIVYDYIENVSVACGDTLLSLARRVGLTDVQKLLERVSLPEDNFPCAIVNSSSELFSRISHIFHFCRPPYNIPFRAYNFNIFRLPFPKTDFTTHFLHEFILRNFDPSMKQSLVRFATITRETDEDFRISNIANCPSTLLMKNRGGNQSFYDSVMQAIFGVCDRANVLRMHLHDHMNTHSDWYKAAFKCQCRLISSKVGISLSECELEEMWVSCLASANDPRRPVEAIHIFALSHVFLRPIIVLPISSPMDTTKRPRNLLSLATSRSSGYHYLEGFYVPYYLKSDLVTRSPICLIHDNGQFFNWIPDEEQNDNNQNFLIVNYPRTQFGSLFRFLEDIEEKQLRGFMAMSQLTPCSVAVHYTIHESISEVTDFYYDYLNAAERADKEQKNLKAMSVLAYLSKSGTNPTISQMFNSSAKHQLNRRFYADSASNESNASVEMDPIAVQNEETTTKMAKVNLPDYKCS